MDSMIVGRIAGSIDTWPEMSAGSCHARVTLRGYEVL